MANRLDKLETSEKTPLLSESTKLVRTTPSKWRQCSVLIACMYLHFMSLGFAPVLGVIYVELIRQFNSARSETAIVQSMYQGLTYVGGILFSGVVSKIEVGPPVMIASASSGLALFISAFSVNIYMVIVLVGFVGGMSMSINYLCAFVAVGWMFVANRRAALAFLTMATAVGQTALPNIADYLIDEYGWAGTFMIASGLILNSIPCGLVLYFSRDFFLTENKTSATSSSVREKMCQCRSKQDVAYIMFVVVCLIFPGTSAVESWFTVDISELRGFDRQQGTILLSLVGAFGLVGRLLGTILLTFWPTISIAIPLAIAFQFLALAHFLVVYLTDFYGMLGGIFVRGISIGMVMCLLPGMQLELRGINRFPRTVALCNVTSGLGIVVCGYLGGFIADWTGSYDLAFYIAVGVSVFCGLLMVVIKCLQYV
ncbi:monocarboxylate transporter 6-like [Mercenaria mercenaria]|uniref:monocarboxylate transporter 6-like n=1 Tax=Mercenaria mercenaria TaxID=6596 RepID=UPI00234F633C|nr:monocarboxylate transporter 6-like [Mercenaria mercenaria]